MNKNSVTISHVSINVSAAIEKYKLSQVLTLTKRQKEVFEEKYGITDGVIKKDAEVAKKFGISISRVSQLCAAVLHKLGFV